jgi:hypothetical protein
MEQLAKNIIGNKNFVFKDTELLKITLKIGILFDFT